MKEIKQVLKTKISKNNKNDIKKILYKLLLKVHPDKCQNPKINSTEVTQQLNKVLEQVK
jgi:curved DNA-binding protein CbpA